ncbi:MAG TPA: hypothetical protein VFH76_31605, partial [Kribbella sp.]|nr:hypothetical protein [Kribbella sp.]
AAVAGVGGRGLSYPRNQRDRDKAELFESVLATVSREVAAVARRASLELRAERIAAGRTATPALAVPKKTAAKQPAAKQAVTVPRARPAKTTGGLKKDASSRAQGSRRQAKRDAR